MGRRGGWVPGNTPGRHGAKPGTPRCRAGKTASRWVPRRGEGLSPCPRATRGSRRCCKTSSPQSRRQNRANRSQQVGSRCDRKTGKTPTCQSRRPSCAAGPSQICTGAGAVVTAAGTRGQMRHWHSPLLARLRHLADLLRCVRCRGWSVDMRVGASDARRWAAQAVCEARQAAMLHGGGNPSH